MGKLSQVAVLASLIVGGAVLQSGTASAMPIDTAPATVAHSETASGVQDAYWAGGYGWHHGYRRHYWGGPRFYGYHRPYGWHRPFWGPRPYGWHRPFHRHFYY